MKISMTGATGHIGANLTRALLDRGDSLRVMVRDDVRAIEGLEVEHVRGDTRDPESVKRLVEGAEVVFNLAAVISIQSRMPAGDWETNVEGPKNVAAACLDCGVRRLVHFSSIHALADHPMDVPIDETRTPAEHRRYLPYNRSKAAGERQVREAVERGLDAVVVNPTGVIGPHDYKPSLMGEGIRDLACGRLPGVVDGGYDWVDVRDVVKGALAAMDRGRKGERYLLSGHWHHFRDIASMLGEITGAKPPGFVSPMWLARIGAPFVSGFSRLTGKRPRYTRGSLKTLRGNPNISHEKAAGELGHAPRPLFETLRDTVEWLRATGRLVS